MKSWTIKSSTLFKGAVSDDSKENFGITDPDPDPFIIKQKQK
jgi:hypothetical protein